jgi:hypothetical protein
MVNYKYVFMPGVQSSLKQCIVLQLQQQKHNYCYKITLTIHHNIPTHMNVPTLITIYCQVQTQNNCRAALD